MVRLLTRTRPPNKLSHYSISQGMRKHNVNDITTTLRRLVHVTVVAKTKTPEN